MTYDRIILAALAAVIFIPTVVLMNQVSGLRGAGESEQLRKKEQQLKLCTRLLIAVFVVILAVTMGQHYLKLSDFRAALGR